MKISRVYQPLDGLTEKEQRIRERRGRRFRVLADTVTYGRTALGAIASLGVLVGGSLLPKQIQHRTVGLALTMTGLAAADKVDGYFARKSVDYGIPILNHDKKKDPFQDKVFAHMFMGSLAVREFIDGNEKYGATIATAQIVKLVRDYKMTQSRERAAIGADVSAIHVNKYKTGLEGIAHTMAVSPLTNVELGRAATAGVYVTSSVMGVIGYKIAEQRHQVVAN